MGDPFHKSENMRTSFISILILLLLVACVRLKDAPAPKELVLINTVGYPNNSRTYLLTDDHKLNVISGEGRKWFYMTLNLDSSRFDELLKAAEDTHAEIKQTKQRHDVGDGGFTRIVLNGNTNDAAVLDHYAKRAYSMEHMESLDKMLNELKELVPDNFWKKAKVRNQ